MELNDEGAPTTPVGDEGTGVVAPTPDGAGAVSLDIDEPHTESKALLSAKQDDPVVSAAPTAAMRKRARRRARATNEPPKDEAAQEAKDMLDTAKKLTGIGAKLVNPRDGHWVKMYTTEFETGNMQQSFAVRFVSYALVAAAVA